MKFREPINIAWIFMDLMSDRRLVLNAGDVAYILQQVADADTILYPVWQSGVHNPRYLAHVLSSGIATVVQGGDPSVHASSDAAARDCQGDVVR